MCQFCTIAIYRKRMIVLCLYLCVYGPVSVLFVLPKTWCHPRLSRPPRPVLMCWYLIWHPSTLPHNPIALKETEIVQPLLSVYPLPCSFGAPIRRVSVHHNARMNVQRCFVSSPQAPRPIWWDGRQLQSYIHALFEILSAYFCRVGIFFCRHGKETRIFLNIWLLPWYHLLWSDMIERVTSAILYLRLPYSCLRYNRQFSFPISVQGKPLLRSNPVNAKIWLWGVAYSTKAICVWVCVCVVWCNIEHKNRKEGQYDRENVINLYVYIRTSTLSQQLFQVYGW